VQRGCLAGVRNYQARNYMRGMQVGTSGLRRLPRPGMKILSMAAK
jgi:predicted RNA-binding protein with PUA-like domain